MCFSRFTSLFLNSSVVLLGLIPHLIPIAVFSVDNDLCPTCSILLLITFPILHSIDQRKISTSISYRLPATFLLMMMLANYLDLNSTMSAIILGQCKDSSAPSHFGKSLTSFSREKYLFQLEDYLCIFIYSVSRHPCLHTLI